MPRPIISGGGRPASEPESHRPTGGWILASAGMVYLVGTVLDLGTLWLGQRQPGIQWEFVAVTNTVEAWPRLILAIGLIYFGLAAARFQISWIYRLLSVSLVVLGIGAVGLGALSALNYFSVVRGVEAGSAWMLKMAAFKTILLCGLYVLLLVPVGVMGLKRKRA